MFFGASSENILRMAELEGGRTALDAEDLGLNSASYTSCWVTFGKWTLQLGFSKMEIIIRITCPKYIFRIK